jgi:hypothetical protein
MLTGLLPLVVFFLLIAPVAFAEDHGQGTYGETDDKVVTNAGFIIIAAVPLFVALMSFIQWRLEKRKYARLAAEKARMGDRRWSAGW